LIFIWEFSSAIAPTAVEGRQLHFCIGTGKLSAARTTVIVIYTAILDSYFCNFTSDIIFNFYPEMIKPGLKSLDFTSVVGSALLTAYIFKTAYSTLFLYGLFFSPKKIKSLLAGITSLPLLKRWHRKAIKLERYYSGFPSN
jgi:hypothetical protein